MAANLQPILADEVILPDDLLADDTTVISDKKGNPAKEMDFDDPDDERVEDFKAVERYKALALAHYNDKHRTDYKFVKVTFLMTTFGESTFIHFGFSAEEGESSAAAKQFCAKLQAPGWNEGEEIVTSCCIVDGPNICEDCYCYTSEYKGSSKTRGRDEDRESEEAVPPKADKATCSLMLRAMAEVKRRRRDKDTESKEVLPLVSQHSHLLADGVTLSDKAKLRLHWIVLALAHYNKKQHTDYKLVDGLPNCFSLESGYGMLYHLNFIARQSNGASNRLFFAEIHKNRNGDWLVTACCFVHGKTTAGCHACEGRQGKRVIHPIRGYRFGLYPRRFGSGRARN